MKNTSFISISPAAALRFHTRGVKLYSVPAGKVRPVVTPLAKGVSFLVKSAR